jgi:cytochrome P450
MSERSVEPQRPVDTTKTGGLRAPVPDVSGVPDVSAPGLSRSSLITMSAALYDGPREVNPDREATSIDLTDPELFVSGAHHAAWAHLRRTAPVVWHEERDGPGFWAITRYADVTALYPNSATFSSERGMMLGVNRGRGDPAAGRMLVVTDPPRHSRLRRLVSPVFTPRVVTQTAEQIVEIVREILDGLPAGGRCDFVTDVAAKLPVAVVCRMMGVPRADWALTLDLTSRAFGAHDAEYQAGMDSAQAAAQAHYELFAYFSELVAERRRRPGDDIVSLLTTSSVDGAGLTDEEVLLNCLNLMIGGNETTRHAASGGLLALLERPDQWQLLKSDPAVLDTAVEEILRWTTPGSYVLRTARADLAVGAQHIRAGQAVTFWMGSANRDEDVFPDADRFLVTRAPNRHLTFGLGEHYCLGSAVARLELRALFGQPRDRVSRLELRNPPVRLRSCLVNGIKHLDVTLHP